MRLHDLKKSSGLNKKAKRLGRGNSSGKGNYSTKGHKGQKARAGYSRSPGFEGGQTSLLQRRPKHKGFKRHFKLIDEYVVINLGNLQKDDRIVDGNLNKDTLKLFGYIKKISLKVKVLGNGNFSKKIDFDGLEKYSKSAIEKIEKSGGKILNK